MTFIDSVDHTITAHRSRSQSAVQIFSGKMNLQKIQAKITPISVPIYELPEYLCVETKCISQQYAKENNITGVVKIKRNALNKLFQTDKAGTTNKKPVKSADAVSKKSTAENHYSQFTEANPSRERSVQTNRNSTTDVGVQCQRDEDDEWWEHAFDGPTAAVNDNEHEAEFLQYVSKHTSIFPNGMLECLQCGEVANCLKEHQNHMVVHFGPRKLCSACGKLVGHQSLLVKHSYSCPSRPNAKSRPIINIQCPHLHCSVMVNSRRELEKHIKEHLGVKAYNCLQCRKSFTSSAQFLVHRTINDDCHKAKHIYLAKHNVGLRRKSNPKRCTVCMKQFGSTRSCMWHRRRCILAYHKRLKKLLYKTNPKELS